MDLDPALRRAAAGGGASGSADSALEPAEDRPDEAAGPALSPGEAERVVSRLSALTQAARVFGSGMAEVDLDIGWAPAGQPERMVWTEGEGGRRRVEIRLDLDRMVAALSSGGDTGRGGHVGRFQTAFLHELGHVIYSGRPPGEPLLDEPRMAELARSLPPDIQPVSRHPKVRALLNQIGEILEDARIERRLADRFRGAPRYLECHAHAAVEAALGDAGDFQFRPSARSGAELGQLVAFLFLQIWGAEDRIARDALPERAAQAAERLRGPLLGAASEGDAQAFADWLVTDLLVELTHTFPTALELLSAESGSQEADDKQAAPSADAGESPQLPPEEAGPEEERTAPDGQAPPPEEQPSAADETGEIISQMAERLTSLGLMDRDVARNVTGVAELNNDKALRTTIIVYPRIDGSTVVDEVPVANAHQVAPTVQSRQVLEQVTSHYGAPALEAFAGERGALRRAFEVNFERRFAGRYRAGRRVGTRNLRRYAVSQDLRLFQRMEVPDRLSYYFHLLIDVSPSMLTDRNGAKAIAVGYAFAESLDRLRVPVDVSLYSAAVTELYDHRRDRLDRYFGGDFGYYSSGTHEIEAIAYAKQKADAVDQTRKLIVVVTDGHPNSVALTRAGGTDLRCYYRDALTPWLRRAGVDLLAIGIGHSPSYHENAVAIGSSWQAIGVFMRLLDGVVAEGRKSHAELWT